MTICGSLNSKDSNMATLVSLVAVSVRAIKGISGNRDLNSCNRENHTLKAACFWLLDCPLEEKKIVSFLICKLYHRIIVQLIVF